MTSFDDREKAQEAKFALDAELKFKALSRRNKMFAEWAGGKLGLSGPALADYVHSILKTEVAGGSDEALIAKTVADFTSKNLRVTAAEVSTQLATLMAKAVADLQSK